MIRDDLKACADTLLRAVDACDEPDELDQLNAVVQAVRQQLQSSAFSIGKALQETKE